jgi:hypothetical protein
MRCGKRSPIMEEVILYCRTTEDFQSVLRLLGWVISTIRYAKLLRCGSSSIRTRYGTVHAAPPRATSHELSKILFVCCCSHPLISQRKFWFHWIRFGLRIRTYYCTYTYTVPIRAVPILPITYPSADDERPTGKKKKHIFLSYSYSSHLKGNRATGHHGIWFSETENASHSLCK